MHIYNISIFAQRSFDDCWLVVDSHWLVINTHNICCLDGMCKQESRLSAPREQWALKLYDGLTGAGCRFAETCSSSSSASLARWCAHYTLTDVESLDSWQLHYALTKTTKLSLGKGAPNQGQQQQKADGARDKQNSSSSGWMLSASRSREKEVGQSLLLFITSSS
jgi:hypothetical protein